MAYLLQRPWDGLIVNAVEWDGESPFAPDDVIVVDGSEHPGVWIGWRWDGETFQPPESKPNPLSPAES